MPHPRAPRRTLLLALALALAACAGPVVPAPAPVSEDVAGGPKGKVAVQVAGTKVRLTRADGTPAAGMVLVVGGRVLRPDASGTLAIPPDLVAAAKAGDVLVLGPGLAPRRLDPATGAVELLPATPIAGGHGAGAPITGGGLALALGADAIAPGTAVAVSTYAPDAAPGWAAKAEAERAALGPQGCEAPLPCPPPAARLAVLVAVDGPLRPGPVTLTLDLAAWLRGWDGQAAAPWEADPAGWPEEARQRAIAAARILRTFAQIDAAGGEALRARLAADHGLALAGRQLAITVPVDAATVATGLVRTDVWGSLLLGVGLEVTILSAVRGTLPGGLGDPVADAAGPPPSLPPGPLGPDGRPPAGDDLVTGAESLVGKVKAVSTSIRGHGPASWLALGGGAVLARGGNVLSNHGARLISDFGGGFISDQGGGFISDQGGGLLGDAGGAFGPPLPAQIAGLAANAGSLEGDVEGPFLTAKYHLAAQFPFVSYAGVEVVLPYVDGAPMAIADATGHYVLSGIPPTAPQVLVATRHDGQTLLNIVPAPRAGVQRADLNPDTTAAAAAALFWLGRGCATPAEFRPAAFAGAVARVAGMLTLTEYQQLGGKLYKAVPGVGSPVEDELGTTFENRTVTVEARNPAWFPIATVQAGQRVGFDASGTTDNGTMIVGPLGSPLDSFYGQIRIRGAGFPEQVIPIGKALAAPANGTIEAWYYDELPQFGDNGGAYDMRLWISGCP